MELWMIFLGVSWMLVLSLTGWAYTRVLSSDGKKHFDPDGTGPATPPAPGRGELKGKK